MWLERGHVRRLAGHKVGGLIYVIVFDYLVEERLLWIAKAKGKICFPGFSSEN